MENHNNPAVINAALFFEGLTYLDFWTKSKYAGYAKRQDAVNLDERISYRSEKKGEPHYWEAGIFGFGCCQRITPNR